MADSNKTKTQQKSQQTASGDEAALQQKIAKTKEDIQFIHRVERAMYEVAEKDVRESEEVNLEKLAQQIDHAEDTKI